MTGHVSACMPCSFALLPHPRSGIGVQPTGLLRVTVTVRWIPLVTAAYGTWVARPARTTMVGTCRRRLQLGQRVRPVFGDHRLVGKSQRARSRVGRLDFHPSRSIVPGLRHAGAVTCSLPYPSCPLVPVGISSRPMWRGPRRRYRWLRQRTRSFVTLGCPRPHVALIWRRPPRLSEVALTTRRPPRSGSHHRLPAQGSLYSQGSRCQPTDSLCPPRVGIAGWRSGPRIRQTTGGRAAGGLPLGLQSSRLVRRCLGGAGRRRSHPRCTGRCGR
jgi:hypothetical protein